MKKMKLTLIIGSFVLGAALYLLNLGRITTNLGRVEVNIYPAATFLLVGLVLLWSVVKQKIASR